MYLTRITITQSTIITSLIGFNTSMLGCTMLFRRFVTLFRRFFSVGSTLFQRYAQR